VEGVGDQGDDNVDLGDLSVEGLSIVDVELKKLVRVPLSNVIRGILR
jgi:hypothetical protein